MTRLRDLLFRWSKENRDLRVNGRRLVLSLFLPLAVIASFVSVSSLFETGVVRSEESLQGMLRDGYSIVSVRTDKLQGMALRNTPDFFRELSLRMPKVDLVLSTVAEVSISDVEQGAGRRNLLNRKVLILLVSDGFFQALDGKWVTGRGFTRGEVVHKAPVAVVSPGLLEDLTGSPRTSISKVFLNGLPLEVIGNWDFLRNNVLENHALIVPISLVPWLGDQERTRVGRLILKGDEAAGLEQLKWAMRRIQTQQGQEQVQPTFELLTPSTSSQNQNLWTSRRGILWLLSRLLIVVAGVAVAGVWYGAHFRESSSIRWRELAGMSTWKICRRLFFFGVWHATIWLVSGALIARAVGWVFLMRRRFHFPFAVDFQIIDAAFLMLFFSVCAGFFVASVLAVLGPRLRTDHREFAR